MIRRHMTHLNAYIFLVVALFAAHLLFDVNLVQAIAITILIAIAFTITQIPQNARNYHLKGNAARHDSTSDPHAGWLRGLSQH